MIFGAATPWIAEIIKMALSGWAGSKAMAAGGKWLGQAFSKGTAGEMAKKVGESVVGRAWNSPVPLIGSVGKQLGLGEGVGHHALTGALFMAGHHALSSLFDPLIYGDDTNESNLATEPSLRSANMQDPLGNELALEQMYQNTIQDKLNQLVAGIPSERIY